MYAATVPTHPKWLSQSLYRSCRVRRLSRRLVQTNALELAVAEPCRTDTATSVDSHFRDGLRG